MANETQPPKPPQSIQEKISAWFKQPAFFRNLLSGNSATEEEVQITDPLTKIYHRQHILELAEKELARIRRYGGGFSLLLLDLDHFKAINELHGQHAGDQVLKAVSDFFRGQLRPTDSVGRFGGEEFLVLLPETSDSEACEVAIRLRKNLQQTIIPHQEKQLQITASIGIALVSAQSESLEEVLAAAERALGQAKRKGRNRIVAAEFGNFNIQQL